MVELKTIRIFKQDEVPKNFTGKGVIEYSMPPNLYQTVYWVINGDCVAEELPGGTIQEPYI